MEEQASRAVEQDAQWFWQLGMINDFIGRGDGGALYVRFDRSRSRVVAAKVDVAAF